MRNDQALIIIAKYPERHSVKTRLKGSLTDNQRLDLYVALLKRTVNTLGKIEGIDTFIAFAPENSKAYFAQFNLKLIPLHKGDLGVRMYEAFREVFNLGYSKAALVGADIPDLNDSIIRDAMVLLEQNDIVFGPAKDGGYYLIGMKKLIRGVFHHVPWSSTQTLEKSMRQALEARCTVGFTKKLSDIDTIEDLRKSGFFLQS